MGAMFVSVMRMYVEEGIPDTISLIMDSMRPYPTTIESFPKIETRVVST